MHWSLIVRLVGGFHEIGPLALIVHDHGLDVTWRRVVLWELRA